MVIIGVSAISTLATYSSIGSIARSAQLHISIVQYIGMQDAGTLVSMLDIHIAHISTSVALTSMQFIVADIVGVQMVVDHGIMAELMVDHVLVLTEDGV